MGKEEKESKKEAVTMAQVFQATPLVKGTQAVDLIKRVMSSKPDSRKIEKLNKIATRISTYQK